MSAAPPEPSAHLDLDALADALAGEGGPAEAAHLAGCASCTNRLSELAAADARVVDTLHRLPVPAVPADLAARLHAALRAEEPLAPTRAASVTALPADGGRRSGRGHSRGRSWLPAAAAAVLAVSGLGLGVAALSGGSGGSDESAATALDSAGGAAGLDLLTTSSGTDWSDPAAVSRALPGVLDGQDEVALTAPQPVAESAEDDADTAAPGGVSALAVDGLERLRTPEGLASCLSAVLPPDEPDLVPLAVDYATYAGEPALAVVLPDPDPAQVSVFVVGAGCSAEGDQTLFFLRTPRP